MRPPANPNRACHCRRPSTEPLGPCNEFDLAILGVGQWRWGIDTLQCRRRAATATYPTEPHSSPADRVYPHTGEPACKHGYANRCCLQYRCQHVVPIYLPDHRWQWHASIGQIHLCDRGWDNCRLESGDQSCRVRPSQAGYLRYHRHPQPQCSWGGLQRIGDSYRR